LQFVPLHVAAECWFNLVRLLL